MAAGITVGGFGLDCGMADAEVVMQACIEPRNYALALGDGAVAGQDNVAGEKVQAVA